MLSAIKSSVITGLICLVVGFVIGVWVRSHPAVKQAETVVRYMSAAKLELPEFNNPSIRPTSQIIFVPTPGDTVLRNICEERPELIIPKAYPDNFLVSKRDPISQAGNELQFRYFDTAVDREMIDTYDIERSPWSWELRAEVFTPLHRMDPIFGPRLQVGHEKLMFELGAYLHPSEYRAYLLGGVSYKLTGSE